MGVAYVVALVAGLAAVVAAVVGLLAGWPERPLALAVMALAAVAVVAREAWMRGNG